MKRSKVEQNEYLKTCIRDGFFKLLIKKPIDKISITEIAKISGVSRMFFYRHYENKDQIIIQYINDTFQEYISRVDKKFNTNMDYSYEVLFDYFRTHKINVQILIDQGLAYHFINLFTNYLRQYDEIYGIVPNFEDAYLDYYYNYKSGAIFSLLRKWFSNGLKESNKEMVKIIKLINKENSNKNFTL